MKTLHALAFVAAASLGCGLYAMTPNTQRGAVPSRPYDDFGIDSVNLFNGNLTVRLPIGPAYTVSPRLSYQFKLAYNSKVWDIRYKRFLNHPTDPHEHKRETIPEESSNAGLGWVLTLGHLSPPVPHTFVTPYRWWRYVAPDGGEHEFNGSGVAGGTYYTVNGTHYRLRTIADGTSTAFAVDSRDGIVRTFDSGGRLLKIVDPYGNWIDVSYGSDQWTVRDGHGLNVGRTHVVRFEKASHNYAQANFRTRVDKIELAGPSASQPLVYDLRYRDAVSIQEGGCGDWINDGDHNPHVPFLDAIVQPDGSEFTATYNTADIESCVSGTLKRLTYPTTGAIEWHHREYQHPAATCELGPEGGSVWRDSSGGVGARLLLDEAENVIQKRTYVPVLLARPKKTQRCGSHYYVNIVEAPPQEFHNTVTTTIPSDAGWVEVDKRRHYFSARSPEAPYEETVYRGEEYGLPFWRSVAIDGRLFLSEDVYDCTSSPCTGSAIRRIYVAYEGDPPMLNSRQASSRTVYVGTSSMCVSDCYVEQSRSSYAGYSSYRSVTTASNIPDTPTRTVFTNYNPGCVPDGTHSPCIAPTAPWLPDMYDTSSVVEEGSPALYSQAIFDTKRGVRIATRNMIGSTAGAGDIMHATCYGPRGFVIAERWLGGDLCGGTGECRPPENPCGDDLANPLPFAPRAGEYGVEHSYEFDPAGTKVLLSRHRARRIGLTYDEFDRTFEPRTGAIVQSADSSGVTTTMAYDPPTARVTSVSAPGKPTVSFSYRNASFLSGEFVPARVTTTTAGIGDSHVELDAFGRAWRESWPIPKNRRALRENRYTHTGAVAFVSEAAEVAAGTDETAVVPTAGTSTTYDQFGRVVSEKKPDGTTITRAYEGDWDVTSTTPNVRTLAGLKSAVTKNRFDGFSRLRSVTERSGTSSAGDPLDVTTHYDYTTRGDLSKVRIVAAGFTPQERVFTYDARGFLTQEKHPEKEEPTIYSTFDARGNKKTVNDAGKELSFEYDAAERTTRVTDSSKNVITERTYAPKNDGASYAAGKLVTAVRYNRLPTSGTIVVTENYRYETPAGDLSLKKTVVERLNGTVRVPIQTFTQSAEYSPLGYLQKLTYPTCGEGCPAAAGFPSVQYGYDAGKVDAVGSVVSVQYHANAAISEITHLSTRRVADKFELQPGTSRIGKVRFEGAVACAAPPQPVIVAPSQVCASSARNAASVDPSPGVTYEWSIAGGTITSTSIGTSITFTAGGAGELTLSVTARNACATTSSAPFSVAVSAGTPPATPVITAPRSVCANTAGHSASVMAENGVAYAWTIEGGTFSSSATEPAVTFAAAGGGAVTLTVTATKTCASASSSAVVATTAPTALAVGSTTVRAGQTAGLLVHLTGTAPWTVTWEDGTVQANVGAPGATSMQLGRPVTPTHTTTYRLSAVTDASGCAGAASGAPTITVEPQPPFTVNAGAVSSTAVGIVWQPAFGAAMYEISRSIDAGPHVTIARVNATAFTDVLSNSATPRACRYFVRTVDATGAVSGPMDDMTVVAPFVDRPVGPGDLIHAEYVNELRAAIDVLRSAYGLAPAFAGVPPVTGIIRAAYFSALIPPLDEGRARMRSPAFQYSGVPVPAPDVYIDSRHVQQIREALK